MLDSQKLRSDDSELKKLRAFLSTSERRDLCRASQRDKRLKSCKWFSCRARKETWKADFTFVRRKISAFGRDILLVQLFWIPEREQAAGYLLLKKSVKDRWRWVHVTEQGVCVKAAWVSSYAGVVWMRQLRRDPFWCLKGHIASWANLYRRKWRSPENRNHEHLSGGFGSYVKAQWCCLNRSWDCVTLQNDTACCEFRQRCEVGLVFARAMLFVAPSEPRQTTCSQLLQWKQSYYGEYKRWRVLRI